MPFGPRMSEARLRWMARERIDDGRLPVMFPPFIRPWYGSEEVCDLCDQGIDRYRVKCEVADPRDGCELAFHLVCYRVWQLECWKAGRVSSAVSAL